MDSFTHLSAKGLYKSFGKQVAVDSVSLQLESGSIHALLGENGAGKTTLVRMLAGELLPEKGNIEVGGEEMVFANPTQARSRNIRMVHQHSSLISGLTIVENFLLDLVSPPLFPCLEEWGEKIRRAASEFGLDIDPYTRVSELSYGQRQWLEVFRSIFNGGDIIILDEPTALLSPQDADRLLGKMRKFAQTGKAVLMITHKIREVFAFADEVTVVRKGKLVGNIKTKGMTRETLYSMMVGDASYNSKDLSKIESEPKHIRNMVEIRDATLIGRTGIPILDKISLDLPSHQITGLAGISGSGQTSLAELICGIIKPHKGTINIHLDEEKFIHYVPEDRMGTGVSLHLTVEENLFARKYSTGKKSRLKRLDFAGMGSFATEKIREYSVTPSNPRSLAKDLSGGNIQRLLLAREIEGPPGILVLHNPTAGLDVETTRFVRDQILDVARNGVAILLISDDLEEILALSDHILVLHDKNVLGPYEGGQLEMKEIAGLMVGEHKAGLEPSEAITPPLLLS